ncbi:hypothetical protein V8C35DRAFT_40266 [Trichoderma chlorosporum]
MDLERIATPERLARGPRDISPSSSSPSSYRTLSLDSRSSISTKPSSRGTSPASEKENGKSCRSRSRRNPKQDTPSWHPMFHPRSYEEIYAERAYLTTSLNVYSINVTELIHQYALVEEVLQAKEHPGKERRKLRKRMSFIKVKLCEASRQEKAIVTRLSELHMEQLGRDAWDQIHQRRAFCSSFPSDATIGPSTLPETPLSATSQEFVPSAGPPARAQFSASEVEKSRTLDTVIEAKEGDEGDDESLNGDDGPRDGEKDAAIEAQSHDDTDDLCNHGLEYTYQRYAEAQHGQLTPPHLSERLASCREERRRSLPNLCSTWPASQGGE